MNLSVTLGRLTLPNPILVASGTFGYAREMAGSVDLARLGGIIPKTVTRHPRAGNTPPRTVETAQRSAGRRGIAPRDGVRASRGRGRRGPVGVGGRGHDRPSFVSAARSDRAYAMR